MAMEFADLEIESRLDLPEGVVGDANPSGLGDPLQARCDIDAVAHQVAVAFLDHVAEMDADANSMRLSGATPASSSCTSLSPGAANQT
jgi:hypothetical protein